MNAKYYWRKVFDHDPRFPVLSDKLAMRDFCSEIRPDLTAPEILWVGDDARAIPNELLSEDVVVKTNHASGVNIFVRNGKVDRFAMEARLARSLRRTHGRRSLEWGYFDILPRIFVERVLPGGPCLQEVKFYTFGRHIERVFRSIDRHGNAAAQIYVPDTQGVLRLSEKAASAVNRTASDPPPETWEHMIEIARDLGEPFDHVRVDLLTDGNEVWMGEMTLYNEGGRHPLMGTDPDSPMCQAWDIRRSWFLTQKQPGWRGCYARVLNEVLDREGETCAIT
jgi:hypothetical protein